MAGPIEREAGLHHVPLPGPLLVPGEGPALTSTAPRLGLPWQPPLHVALALPMLPSPHPSRAWPHFPNAPGSGGREGLPGTCPSFHVTCMISFSPHEGLKNVYIPLLKMETLRSREALSLTKDGEDRL